MNLTATVIEIAPQEGYVILRFQLAGTDTSATTGDCFSVALEDASGYMVGDVFEFGI